MLRKFPYRICRVTTSQVGMDPQGSIQSRYFHPRSAMLHGLRALRTLWWALPGHHLTPHCLTRKDMESGEHPQMLIMGSLGLSHHSWSFILQPPHLHL